LLSAISRRKITFLQKVNPLLDFGCLLSGGDNFLNASDKKKGVAKIKQHKETVAANWIDLSKKA